MAKMKPKQGMGLPGKRTEPTSLPETPHQADAPPKAAPAPGLPVSNEEYERMKQAAKQNPPPRVKQAQEDASAKNEKGKPPN